MYKQLRYHVCFVQSKHYSLSESKMKNSKFLAQFQLLLHTMPRQDPSGGVCDWRRLVG